MEKQYQNANAGANNESVGAIINKNIVENNTTITFDDFLKIGKNQAEFDRRVQKAIKTAKKGWNSKNNQEKLEIKKLHYKLQKKQEEYEIIQKKLNVINLKYEGLKIAVNPETAFEPEFLSLFQFEDMTKEELKEKTKALKTIQDRIVKKVIL